MKLKMTVMSLVAGLLVMLAASASHAATQVATFESLSYSPYSVIPDGATVDGLVIRSNTGSGFDYSETYGYNDSRSLITHYTGMQANWVSIQLDDGSDFKLISFYYDNSFIESIIDGARAIDIEGIRNSSVHYSMRNVDIYTVLTGTISFSGWDSIDTLKITVAGGSNLDFSAYFDHITYDPDVNFAPTDIALSNSSIAENSPQTSSVGTFSTTDANAGDTFSYTLVSGDGSADNTSFAIDGDTLKLNHISLDYETKNTYYIRVRTADSANAAYEEAFIISVTDVDETTLISSAGVTGVAAPAAGAAPQTSGSLSPVNAAEYTVTGIAWQNSGGGDATLTGDGKFKAGSTYRAEIQLTSAAGCKFPADGLTPATDAGTPAAGTVSGGDTAGNTLTFTVAFPATAALSATGITVTSQPDRLFYAQGEPLNLDGLMVALTYNDGTTQPGIRPASFAANGITTDPAASIPLTVADHHAATVEVVCNSHTDHTSALTVAAAAYTLTASHADTFYLHGLTGLTFVANGSFSSFTGVTVDGIALSGSQYSAYSGSTVVTLLPEYLNTLSLGNYTLRLVFTDGYASTGFSVLPAPDMPDTGDARPVLVYAVLAMLALVSFALLLRLRCR